MNIFHCEQDAVAASKGEPLRPATMLIFYFRELNGAGGRILESFDILISFTGTQEELRQWLGGKQPALTFAIFDLKTTPPTLTYRARGVQFSFKDARRTHELFPQFYIGEHGDIWDADSFSKIPVMWGPAQTLRPVRP